MELMSDSSNQERGTTLSSDDQSPTPITSNINNNDINNMMKGMLIVYKECLKNHAASLGGNAKDGCGEFMPTREDGLQCSVCGCHRNFHRKQVDVGSNGGGGGGYLPQCPYYLSSSRPSTPTISHQSKGVIRGMYWPQELVRSIMGPAVNFPKVEIIEENGESGKLKIGGVELSKKRHRTKFTNEQKERMLGFAEKAKWRIQKLDEKLVQEFCQEIGLKRRTLKIWMHNNKQHYVTKDTTTTTSPTFHLTSNF